MSPPKQGGLDPLMESRGGETGKRLAAGNIIGGEKTVWGESGDWVAG